MAYLKKISTIGKILYPSLLWNLPSKQKTLYLTFDDGPIPEVTPWVLALLKEYHAKATFFLIGENIVKHPEIFDQVMAAGHKIGNHSFNHLNGWKTPSSIYIKNVAKAEDIICGKQLASDQNQNFRIGDIAEREDKNIKLFRPPYGKITPKQIKALQGQGFKIVMWEVISGDFDAKLSAENCLNNVLKNSKKGSIVVFHDSLKASEKLKEVLPKVLEFYHQKGFEFKAI